MQQRSGPYGPPSQNQLLLISVHSFIVFHTWSVEMTCSDWSIVAFWFYLCITLSLLRGFGFFFLIILLFFSLTKEQHWQEWGRSAQVQVSSRVHTSGTVCFPQWFPKGRNNSLIQATLLVGLPDFMLLFLYLPIACTKRVYGFFFQQMKYSIKQWTFHNIR